MDKTINEIGKIIKSFQKRIKKQLPHLEQEVNFIIQTKVKNENKIENLLDILLSLTSMGIEDELFIKLLEYYKTVSTEGAHFYWNAYDNDDN